jgi:hypothetical protein
VVVKEHIPKRHADIERHTGESGLGALDFLPNDVWNLFLAADFDRF